MMMTTRTAREMYMYDSFLGRFRYLSLRGVVGETTFGFDRYINQGFYRSREWKNLRQDVIARDNGCDLGVEGHEISARILVHHMNPLRAQDIMTAGDYLVNPDFLVTTTHNTHNAIHYGDESLLPKPYEPRKPRDTKLW